MRLNRNYVAGGLWWAVVFGGTAIGAGVASVKAAYRGDIGYAAVALFVGVLCAVVGWMVVSSMFSTE